MNRPSFPGPGDDLPVVLCVSEDKAFLNIMRINLGQAGFVAVALSNAADALDLVSESKVDAMICDYDMSQMDGITLYERIRASLDQDTPPTLITGEHYAAPLLARCLKAGTAGLHAKSDPAETLIEQVISLIGDEGKRARMEQSAATRMVHGSVDPVTRIASKDHFMRRLSAESVASYRDGNDLAVLVFDIDRYDRIDERFGRQTAENLLVQVALMVEGELRSRDCVARFADHSFGVVLPESGLDASAAVGRRLRRTIGASEFGDLDHPMAITISVGASCRRSGMRASPAEMVSLAEKNCSAAIQMGGDRLVADALLTGKPLALVIGADSAVTARLLEDLERANVEPRLAGSVNEAMGALSELPAAMIFSVHPLPPASKDILVWARDRQPVSRRILVAAESGENLLPYAVNRAAIHYYLPIPWETETIAQMVDQLIFS
jgi:diguanylate cyclase (GGDEF)-like protein